MAKTDLIKYVVENKFVDFQKEYNKVFEESFDKYASLIEKNVCKALSGTLTREDEEKLELELEPMEVATEPIVDIDTDYEDDSDEELHKPEIEIISIEELEDNPSIIIKFKYDGENEDEVRFDDEEKIRFYHEILQKDELEEPEVEQIKVDILDSVRKRVE